MFGLRIARVRGRGGGSTLPHGTIALFRQKRPKRGDVVLIDHPENGNVARKVSAIGRKGNVHFSTSSQRSDDDSFSKVPMDDVRGILVSRLGRIALPGRQP